MKDIIHSETQIGHKKTIIVGDFNMNPFDYGMIAGPAMNSVMTKKIASRGSRTIQKRKFHFFYNPMWGCFGDRSDGLAGTYYYDKSGHVNYYWNIFDQVLLRPELIKFFIDQKLKILISDGNSSLLNSNGIPDCNHFSDHLPILFSLEV